jgi:TolA-binding protein
MEEIDKNEYYQIRIKQIISIMKKKQYIAETEERIKETEERIKETEEKIKELKDFIKELETFEKLFEKKSNQNSIPQSPKMKTSPKSHQKHPNSHQKIAA